MKVNWTILATVAIAAVILLVIIYIKNKKDKAALTKSLNNDYKSADEEDPEPNDGDTSR